MLSEILSPKTCAKCKFCCSFRRKSLWETPLFSDEAIQKLSQPNEYGIIANFKDRQTPLENFYKTSDPEEEVPSPFLDPSQGCTLKGEDKPFDCSIWPLRIMDKGGKLVITLTPTCPSIGATPNEKLLKLVASGLGEKIFEYAQKNPYIIKGYKEDFRVIAEHLK